MKMNGKNLTQGSVIGNIMTFSLPYMLAYFLQILYGLADLFVIGQYCGVDSTTAVSNGAQLLAHGAEYLRGYVWDCIFAGIHFTFSGFFTACGLSVASFLHNSVSAFCVRIPLAWLSSTIYPDTLYPMGLSTLAGSMFSCLICAGAYLWMRKKAYFD